MGWSCRKEAGLVLEAWGAACVAAGGSSNAWHEGDAGYFFEVSRKEHDDGAITGAVMKMLSNGWARRAGTFRIDGDGKIERAPKFLKEAAVKFAGKSPWAWKRVEKGA
jgi:hypothetical protein